MAIFSDGELYVLSFLDHVSTREDLRDPCSVDGAKQWLAFQLAAIKEFGPRKVTVSDDEMVTRLRRCVTTLDQLDLDSTFDLLVEHGLLLIVGGFVSTTAFARASLHAFRAWLRPNELEREDTESLRSPSHDGGGDRS